MNMVLFVIWFFRKKAGQVCNIKMDELSITILVSELTLVQAVVETIPGKELLMSSLLHHLPFFEHDYLIGAGNG